MLQMQIASIHMCPRHCQAGQIISGLCGLYFINAVSSAFNQLVQQRPADTPDFMPFPVENFLPTLLFYLLLLGSVCVL